MKQQEVSPPILQASHVSRYFTRSSGFLSRKQSFAAVHDVSLSVTSGMTLGIIGESGCGKSTLGKMVAGLLSPSAGEITIHGKPVYLHKPHGSLASLPHTICKTVQMVFQDPNASLNPRMRIGDSVGEPLKCLYPEISAMERAEKVQTMLAEVGIAPEYSHRYPHAFSGGQRQRIAIARALIANPAIIICDEPTSSLDSSVQAQVLNLLDTSQKRHDVAYIFISHDLAVVRHMSDEVAVMYNGTIVEQGAAEAVFAHPAHPYTHLLLESVPSLSTFKQSPSHQHSLPTASENAQQPVVQTKETPLPPTPPTTVTRQTSPISPPRPFMGCPFAPRCPKAVDHCHHHFPELTQVVNCPTNARNQPLESHTPAPHVARCFLAQ